MLCVTISRRAVCKILTIKKYKYLHWILWTNEDEERWRRQKEGKRIYSSFKKTTRKKCVKNIYSSMTHFKNMNALHPTKFTSNEENLRSGTPTSLMNSSPILSRSHKSHNVTIRFELIQCFWHYHNDNFACFLFVCLFL